MAWWMAIPFIIQAGAGLLQGKQNAANSRIRAQAARDQGAANEAASRRASRQVIGRQAAAMAEAGGGIDEGVLNQSLVNAELDALNIRYGTALESIGLEKNADRDEAGGGLLAGGQLLQGAGSFGAFGGG